MQQLTSIRGILALAICLYHIKGFLAPYLPTYAMILVSNSYIAVDFFFSLSGFILTWKYVNDFEKFDRGNYKTFILNRTSRIFPLHVFFTLLYISIPLAFAVTGRATLASAFSGNFSITELFKNLLLIQNWFPNQTVSWNLPSWSISVEFAMYLAMPIVLYLINKPFAKELFAAFAIMLFLRYADAYSDVNVGSVFLGPESIHRGIIGFSFGILAYLVVDKVKFTICIAALALIVFLAFDSAIPESYLINPAAALTLMALCNLPHGLARLFTVAPLVYLGEISYSIYLSHYLIRDLLNMVLLENDGSAPVWWILLYVAVVLITSSLTYKYVEKASQARLRSLYRQTPALA